MVQVSLDPVVKWFFIDNIGMRWMTPILFKRNVIRGNKQNWVSHIRSHDHQLNGFLFALRFSRLAIYFLHFIFRIPWREEERMGLLYFEYFTHVQLFHLRPAAFHLAAG